MRHIRYLGVSEYQDTFWPFYDNSRLFPKISQDYRIVPNTTEELRGLPKTSKDYRRCPSHNRRFPKFSKQIRNEKSSKHFTEFSRETVKIKNLVNLTANTKNYGQITLNTKPHSDPLLLQFRLFQKISEDCWGFAKTAEDFLEQPTISEGKFGIFLNEKNKQRNLKTKNPPST